MQCTYDKLTLRSLGLERGQASYKYSITHRLSATSPTRAKLIHPKQLALRSSVRAIQRFYPPFVVFRSSGHSYRRRNGHDTAVSKNTVEVLIIREFGQGHAAKDGGRHFGEHVLWKSGKAGRLQARQTPEQSVYLLIRRSIKIKHGPRTNRIFTWTGSLIGHICTMCAVLSLLITRRHPTTNF